MGWTVALDPEPKFGVCELLIGAILIAALSGGDIK
jgi:hypothetical protein